VEPAEISPAHDATKTPAPARPKPLNRPVNLSTVYNASAIYTEGTAFSSRSSIDQVGSALPDELLKATIKWGGATFYGLKMLALGVNGNQESQVFTLTYADGTSSSFTQSLSDWYTPENFPGESEAVLLPYRLTGDGRRDEREFHVYGYSFSLDDRKTVRTLTLPENPHVLVLAITLVRGLPANASR